MSISPDAVKQSTNGPVDFLLEFCKDGPWSLAAIDPKGGAPVVRGFTRAELTDMREWIAKRNGKLNLYFFPNRTRRRVDKMPSEADMAYCDYFYADCDPNDDESPAEANNRYVEALEAHEPPPTFHYSSGNGRVGLWRLVNPIKLETAEDIANCKATNQAIARKLGADHCQSLDHLFRLPFTLNIPNAKKRAKGRVPIMSGDLVSYPERECCDFDFEAAPSIVPESREFGPAERVDDLDELNLPNHVRELIEEPFEPGGKYESRSERDFAGISGMWRNQVPAEKIMGVLTSGEWPIGERLREKSDPDEAARKEVERAIAKLSNPESDFDTEPPEVKKKTLDRLKARSLSSVMAAPDPKWLIEGILTENCLFEVFGQFKAGKTFYGLELGLCIATGHDFFDAKTTQGKVIYVIAEGNAKLFGYRVQQWITERAGGDKAKFDKLTADVEANFAILPISVHMDAPKTVAAFLEANPGKYAAVFVDTLMRNMTGDPLKPADMMKFMAGCDTIREETGAAVVFFHHMRRDNGTGGFGSIVGEAFVDGAAIVSRNGNERHFKLHIMRDGDDSAPAWVCRLESRNVLLSWGEERNTAVLVYVGRKGQEPGIKLLAHIYGTEPETVEKLKETFGGKGRTVERELASLRKRGLLEKKGLQLTIKGLEAVGEMEEEEAG